MVSAVRASWAQRGVSCQTLAANSSATMAAMQKQPLPNPECPCVQPHFSGGPRWSSMHCIHSSAGLQRFGL